MPGSRTAAFDVSSKCALLPALPWLRVSTPRVAVYWPAFTRWSRHLGNFRVAEIHLVSQVPGQPPLQGSAAWDGRVARLTVCPTPPPPAHLDLPLPSEPF